jgi:hypothetical protein
MVDGHDDAFARDVAHHPLKVATLRHDARPCRGQGRDARA